ncbi:zinc finger and BTB domain-containing protein 12 [Equus asinus]|uniref:Zinc finger and BTB domain containing 12 n=3 Tax=Equus TaxID=9789 RepID=A0A3Q2HAK9_HORSE|nr:zinc finger and BTB domain-containing protein 12 [Equus caballus]XP_023480434.1 zinc finger and BTB domain-containing protein 12 [Equus caballus]XP_023480435.1 zinc finger and BTB domain-containing protein 12 [Equus caballus]XP_023480436.1 zinc finger and BTB domain-containing protein 12 [Equus caballus]XP_044632229.1 zinc finger and BTB domain-containing protein 12 [Equus asinus]XP_044632230.1 zinc finger and BTB domain-containing protein 12 [Equus asinus]XP_044632231.1 zinc finger and BT
MASGVEVLRFQLPGHEAATLRNMNQLRAEERFCDVTIVADSLKFRGHKVILAACSPFLRDQFLLNPSSELQVSLMHSARIVADLLLSCYTGALEFAVRDIVNYLTAASYLQMEHVVEKCRNALSQFIEPKIGLKEDGVSDASLVSSVSATKSLLPPARTPKPAPKPPPPPPLPPPLLRPVKLEYPLDEDLELKAEEEDEDEDEDVSDICIVKVESALEVAHRLKPPGSLGGGLGIGGSVGSHLGELTQSSVPPSTVAPPQGVVKACYSLSEDAEGEGLLLIPGGRASVGATSGLVEAAAVAMAARGAGGSLGAGGSRGPLPGGFSSGNPLKNIKCTKCPEVFQGVEKLVFHMRAQHFIFMCPRCGKQFNHSSNLNRHMNVHRGVKSHSCGICGKCFTQKSTLHDHLNLHSGARPYRCSYCDVRFAHKPAIRRHLKEQHGKTTAENVLEASVAEINVLIR